MRDESLDLPVNVQQALQWRPPELAFEPIEEAQFNAACAEARLTHFMRSGGIALMAYLMFLLADQRMIPDVYEQAFAVRVYWYTPFALFMLVMGLGFRRFVLSLPMPVLEVMVTLTGVLAAFSLGWLAYLSHSPFAGMYTAGLVPIVVYGNLVQRFRFRYALAFSLAVCLICAACAWSRHGQGLPYAQFDLPLVLLVCLLAGYTLIMNYRLELEERRRYQVAVRSGQLLKELSASKAQLDDMSRRDPLTGVPNRRHVDEYVQRHWSQAEVRGGSLAVLLMDVDHFKAFNDHYGHPAGDQCLRHVADILQKAVPQQEACVARWGGEEFIVVMPHAQADQALAMAQTLCDAVNASSLRHQRSPTASCVTISVGVAVAQAGDAILSVDGLLARADRALYRAKHDGRNRAHLDELSLPRPA